MRSQRPACEDTAKVILILEAIGIPELVSNSRAQPVKDKALLIRERTSTKAVRGPRIVSSSVATTNLIRPNAQSCLIPKAIEMMLTYFVFCCGFDFHVFGHCAIGPVIGLCNESILSRLLAGKGRVWHGGILCLACVAG